MALSSTIQLNKSSVQAGAQANAVVTISNDALIPVTIMTLRPTVIQTGDPIPEDASSVAKASMPLLQAFNNVVPASGFAQFPFSFNCHTPSGDGSQGIYTGPQLGAADSFALLAGSAITNTGPSVINGDVGVSPGSSITPGGWTLVGTSHAADAQAAAAQISLTAAYNDLAGRAPTANLTGQDLGTVGTLGPGVYKFNTSGGLTGTLTLDGQNDPSSVFIFQFGSTLTTAAASSVVLINGALPGNVFWQVGSSATLGTTTAFQGNILAQTAITANTGATVLGRMLARTAAVVIDTTNTTKVSNSSQLPGSGSYSVSCQIEAADGQNLSPVPATITVTAIV